MQAPADLAASAPFDRFAQVAADVYAALGSALKAANAMDFDDLLLHPLTLFDQHPDRLEAYRRKFQFVLVDEFQDTNRAQYLLVKRLGAHGNVCAVGDDVNDIPMITSAGFGVAVGNAVDEVKAAADRVARERALLVGEVGRRDHVVGCLGGTGGIGGPTISCALSDSNSPGCGTSGTRRTLGA